MTAPDPSQSVARHLKSRTHDAHEALDQRIMASAPFSSITRYVQFLHVQRRFHATIDPLFKDPILQHLVPELTGRRRLHEIEQDIGDLSLGIQAYRGAVDVDFSSPATPWGWLYVAEGSKLGAAILLKHARGLGLSETAGARHLAAHADGRARHWRSFVDAVDQLPWTEPELRHMVEGARQAFSTMQALVEQEMHLFGRRSETESGD